MNRFKILFAIAGILIVVFFIASGIYFHTHIKYKKPEVASVNAPVELMVDLRIDSLKIVHLKSSLVDFESSFEADHLTNEKHYSGKKSLAFSPNLEYGATITQAAIDFLPNNIIRKINVSFRLLSDEDFKDNVFVLEAIDSDGKMISWQGEGIPSGKHKWDLVDIEFNVDFKSAFQISHFKTYVWNKNKNTFYIDDLNMEYLGNSRPETFDPPPKISSFYYDMEGPDELENGGTISEDVAHSGKRSSLVSGKNSCSASISKKYSDVVNGTLKLVLASAWIYPTSKNQESTFVFEVRSPDGSFAYWGGKSIADMNLEVNTWHKLNAMFQIPQENYQKFRPDDELHVYMFNNNDTKVYVDDILVSFGDVPAPPGSHCFVEMNSVMNNKYTFDRTHPPYPIRYISLAEIGNHSSSCLIDNESECYGRLNPGENIFAGKFISANSGTDELISINEASIELYQFCKSAGRFVIAGKIQHSFQTITHAVTGDFTGNGKQEIFLITHAGSVLLGFSELPSVHCADNLNGSKMHELWSGEFGNQGKLLSADLTGDHKDELILTDPAGRYRAMTFDGHDWKIIAENNSPFPSLDSTSTQITGLFSRSGTMQLITCFMGEDKIHTAFISLNGNKLKAIDLGIDNVFAPDDQLFRVQTKGKLDEIISFNHSRRFELKKIYPESRQFYISSTIDFRGYDKDQNPKYYEFPKIIPGNFTGSGLEILCILRNCADVDFDGKHCRQFQKIQDLPDKIQLYKFN